MIDWHVRSRNLAIRTVAILALAAVVAPPAAAGNRTEASAAGVTAVRQTQKKAKAVTTRRKKTSAAARRRAAAARVARDARKPRFKVDESGDMVPDVRAAAAIVYNPETGETLYSENADTQRSMASLTKVMTAAVFLEENPDLDREVLVERADVRAASTTHIRAGYRLQVRDLLNLLLIASDNAAARVLARVSTLGPAGFIDRMNTKAIELGLTSTSYADPAGLLAANKSSALDIAKLITHVSADERIASIMQKPSYAFRAGTRTVEVRSTNQLVRNGDVDVQAGKTGFTRAAGYCLATLLRLPQGSPVAVVVLGATSSAVRFWETRHLFNWLSTKVAAGTVLSSHTAPISSLPQ